MSANAAETEVKSEANVHEFVKNTIINLQGSMEDNCFAKKNGINVGDLQSWKAGTSTPCLYALKFLASRNCMDAEGFFPDRKVPEDYPTH